MSGEVLFCFVFPWSESDCDSIVSWSVHSIFAQQSRSGVTGRKVFKQGQRFVFKTDKIMENESYHDIIDIMEFSAVET